MDLNILWFILITVLFIGFFFLEGFDYGVGALVPILGKDDDERRVVLNTIGPFWDGNEVWLITAGGAMFAAFPHVYATMFSGWYLALFLILLALILRATGIEFRSQKPSLSWRKKWDAVIAISSILSAILWGVAVSNLVIGVPIDADMQYAGSFFTLLRPFCLVGGVMLALIFLYHGACYLMLKAGDQAVLERAQGVAEKLGIPMIVVTVVWVVWAFFASTMFENVLAIVFVALAAVLMILSVLFTKKHASGKAFICMTKVALTLVPVVLAYQIWSFYVFRARVTKKKLKY